MDTGLPDPSNAQGFVRFLSHGNFFDERVDPSKRRCRGVGGLGERRNCQGVRARNVPGRLAFNHVGFQTEGSGNGTATPCSDRRSMRPVGLQQSSSLSAARERMQKKKKKNAQGSAEGGA
jgi:hypothetical protein